MKAIASGFLIAAAILASAPVAFAAEYFIPPGNSAASQYTQSLPSAGGKADTTDGLKEAKPGKVLGSENAKKLHAQGPEGQAAAELAAQTAPPSVSGIEDEDESSQPSKQPKDQDKGEGKDGEKGGGEQHSGGGAASGGNGNGGANGGGGAVQVSSSAADPAGSGGFGEVLGKATGLSTGGSSWLLPLAILAAVAWAIVYLARQRRTETPLS